jgi:hypothetical protein
MEGDIVDRQQTAEAHHRTLDPQAAVHRHV